MCCCDTRLEEVSLKEERLFLLMVSEASVHSQLAPLLWACGEADTVIEGYRREKPLTHGEREAREMQRAGQEEKARPHIVPRPHPLDPLLSVRPCLLPVMD